MHEAADAASDGDEVMTEAEAARTWAARAERARGRLGAVVEEVADENAPAAAPRLERPVLKFRGDVGGAGACGTGMSLIFALGSTFS